ncbi:MAG: extracellular solute-binding protein [Candidatus Omnitrophica bacterium]|nr:extracellular solute-binding protein [Candidatus Omnitrophota bacterium]
MKKPFLFCASAVFLFALISCGPGSGSKDRLTVTMSLGESEWQVMRSKVFPLFESRYGVKVEGIQIESGSLATKLDALQKAGKAEIDVVAQDNMNLAVLVNKGLVEDLSQYEDEIPANTIPSLVQSLKFDGRLLFMPFRPNVQIVYYHKEKFDEYGLEVPRTWEQLRETAKMLKEKEERGRILLKGFGGNPTATQVYEFILQAGGEPYAFDDEGCIRAFAFLQKLWPYAAQGSQRAKWDTTNRMIANQQVYLAQNWPFGVTILVKEYGLDFIGTYSGWKGPHGERHVIGGDVLGIPSISARKELARKFIWFLQSKEVQELLVGELGWPSMRTDAYGQVEEWQKQYYASVQKAMKHGEFRENVTWWPAYVKYVTEAFREIVIEQAPVEETLKKYKKKLEGAKELYRER